MKKIGLSIALALVIVLMAVLGSVSAASAAKHAKPGSTTVTPSISVSINYVTGGLIAAEGSFNISYSWDNQATFGYYITIRDNTANDPNNPYVYCSYNDLGTSTNSFSGSDSISCWKANSLHAYTIGLYLVKNNGDIFACAYSDYPN
jgi:hypothetical protein